MKLYSDAALAKILDQEIFHQISAVADRLGVTRTAVHYWESGKRTIYAVNLIEYCKVLGVDPREIIDDLYT